jgi:hypothetical protein
MRAAVERLRLDLRGLTVFTEAATGAYAVTPVLAAMAGAERVWALTRPSRYGSTAEVMAQTGELAQLAGVDGNLRFITEKSRDIVARADIVTNSGHVRPIDAEMVGWMKPGAVVPLMYEAWEFRDTDLDLAACRLRGIPVAGTNERHPEVNVFAFLGLMAVRMLLDAGIEVYGARILLLCDNPFAPFISRGLADAGAEVETAPSLAAASADPLRDAVLVALTPQDSPVMADADAAILAATQPQAVVAQFWGDLDRQALARRGVQFWPASAPAPGHMGILPSHLGPEPIIRLQSGGLKVGEVMARAVRENPAVTRPDAAVAAAVASGFGQPLNGGPPS